jgi:hypothetical protein
MPSFLFPLLVAVAAAAGAQPTAQSILAAVRAKQAERWATVDNYTVTLSVRDSGNLQAPIYYEKMTVDGKPAFRMVPRAEYEQKAQEEAGFPPLTPEAMKEMAQGLDMVGAAVAGGGGDMPPMDLRGMTGQMSDFLRFGATAEVGDGRAEAVNAAHDMEQFAARARLEGTEKVTASGKDPGEKRDAYRIVADDLSDITLDQPEGDAEFTLKKVSLWIDTENYVPLRLLMEGNVEAKGKTSPMTIEKQDLDYAPAGPLYESRQQVFTLGGMMAGMSEKDRKDLEKARKELEKAKQQLADMPEDQRKMVMKMMGSKMEQMEQMASGGDITSITDVVNIAVNEGPPTPYGPGSVTVGGPAAADYPHALTYAGDDGHAELSIAARLPGQAEATIGLVGADSYPKSGEVAISGASGHVELEGGVSVVIEGGSGTITVTERTETRIAGTFTALLTGEPSTGDGTTKVHFSASGTFDSGAPVGPYQAPRGSPFPADLFGSGQ